MFIDNLPMFITASIVLLAIPGPDMLAIVSRGIYMGRDIAVVTAFGYLVGDVIQTLFVAIGLAAVINSSPMAIEILRVVGAAYLVYLGIRTILDRHKSQASETGVMPETKRVVLRQSIVASTINPKTALFFIAFLPQFVTPEQGNELLQILFLGAVFAGLGFVAYLPVAVFAGRIGHWLSRSKVIKTRLPIISGGIFVGLGLFLGFYPNEHSVANQ